MVPGVSVQKHSWLRRPTERTLLLVSIALALVVSAIIVCANWNLIAFSVSAHGTRFEVVDNGMPTWYEVGWGTVAKVGGPAGYENAPVTVLEAVPYEAPNGDVAVLARVAGSEGVVLGLLHTDNTFSAVLADGSTKSSLAVRPDGLALYAARVAGESHILQINIHNPETLKDLGRGKSPRLFKDGFFVAITQKGIVRIDPADTTHTVLLARTNADLMHSSLSTDGARAIVPSTSGKTEFITLQSLSPAAFAIDSSVSEVYRAPAVWVSKHFFVVPNHTGGFVPYGLYGKGAVPSSDIMYKK